jgi:hypothetical protein
MAAICEQCKKTVGELTPRYVLTKKRIMNICNECIAKFVTHDPSIFIPDGDVIICTK